MKIVEVIQNKMKDPHNNKIPTIVCLGDSVTQGCFSLYMKAPNQIGQVFDKQSAYPAYVERILAVLYPGVPINVINAGISGDTTQKAIKRLERDVLAYQPDLTVVALGLNDCGAVSLEEYCNNLQTIIRRAHTEGSEVIYLTPNMMNTKISCHLKDNGMIDIAQRKMRIQNDGILDAYLDAGKQVAHTCGATVCDVYAKWKLLEKSGVDITEMLSNKINHPTKEFNWISAFCLVETIISNNNYQ